MESAHNQRVFRLTAWLEAVLWWWPCQVRNPVGEFLPMALLFAWNGHNHDRARITADRIGLRGRID